MPDSELSPESLKKRKEFQAKLKDRMSKQALLKWVAAKRAKEKEEEIEKTGGAGREKR